uniref:Class II major histocompatibility complex transactivator n=1 Tax=Ursus americanus TaxID=9643 RepID=A0A452QSH4_URSAM
MELGPLEGGYLELLNSSADPLQLYHLYDQTDLAREEIELCSEPDMDTINCEQFSRLLCDMEGDEETREAYANIAELDQYVFQDSQLDGLGKDIFIEHIGLEEMISESVEVEEAGQKSQKRREPCPRSPGSNMVLFLTAEPLAVPVVTGTFLVGSVSDSSALPCLSPPAVFNKEPASSQSWLEEPVLMPVPPSSSLLSCLSLPAGRIQIVPSLPSLPQGLWQISGAGTGVSGMVIYQGEMPQASQVLPSSGPAMQSLPKSPERPGSTSPFAPSAADLPGMPEPALTSRANMTEDQMSPTQCLTAHEVSSKPPKWPGEWWGALCALGQEVEAQIGFSCTHSPCTPPLFVGWLIHPLTCSLDSAPH